MEGEGEPSAARGAPQLPPVKLVTERSRGSVHRNLHRNGTLIRHTFRVVNEEGLEVSGKPHLMVDIPQDPCAGEPAALLHINIAPPHRKQGFATAAGRELLRVLPLEFPDLKGITVKFMGFNSYPGFSDLQVRFDGCGGPMVESRRLRTRQPLMTHKASGKVGQVGSTL
jgi:hypothetical protein